ncbi:phage major capsid protein [Actinoallomurus sp. CA-150999]|uniref:phage major capsid protein n=1 Tax=Actinoallomurus sp. CA-150999 TaxID=3239887 RepID=UPI003D942337
MRSFDELNKIIKEARDKAARLRAEANEIHTRCQGLGRDLTEGESERFDRLMRGFQVAQDEAEAARDEYREQLRAMVAGGRAGFEPGDAGKPSPEFMRQVDPFDGQHAARDRARALLDDSRRNARHLSDEQRTHLDGLLRSHSDDNVDVSYLAMRTVITEDPHYRSAFLTMLAAGMAGRPPMLTNDEITALRRLESFEQTHSRSMAEATGTAGGFGVPVFIDPTIILTAQGTADIDAILRISRVETITTNQWKGVSSAGVTWSFDNEGTVVSDDSPTLAQPTVPVYMARGFVPYSIEVGQDYPGFASEMGRLLTEGYAELVTNKITLGSGTNEPRGIVTALAANTNVQVATTTAGTFAAGDVYKLWDALPRRFRRTASWMSSTNVENGVRQLGTGQVDSGANFSINLTQESVEKLFGREYVENEWMADLVTGTTAANLLIVGDFTNLVVAQRAGMQVEPVQHLFDPSTGRPTGQRGLFAWARVGSNSVNDLGFRMLQNKTS